MTLKDIDFILELAQTQNFNRAAENLYTAQPTFSYHIKAAEEELGFPRLTTLWQKRTTSQCGIYPGGH